MTIPALAAGAVLLSPLFTVEVTNKGLLARKDGVVTAEYRRIGVPFKPYLLRLCTPAGMDVIRDAPDDHRHHHGLMFALNAAGINFWEETPGCGVQRSDGVTPLRDGWEEALTWAPSPTAAPTLQERRRITFLSDIEGVTMLTWKTTLEAPKKASAPLRLSGDHYHGLGMRFVSDMDGGTFEAASGEPGTVFRGEERLMGGAWCAYRASSQGKLVTVAMFDDRRNPRKATWFTMPRPFAYLAATLRLHEKPLELRPGDRITLRYGVAAWDGNVEARAIGDAYRLWSR